LAGGLGSQSVGGGEIPSQISRFVESHCSACHDAESPEAGLDVSKLTWAVDDRTSFDRWVIVLDRVANHEMPPGR